MLITGSFDMTGNLWEWNDLVVDSPAPRACVDRRDVDQADVLSLDITGR